MVRPVSIRLRASRYEGMERKKVYFVACPSTRDDPEMPDLPDIYRK